MTSGIWSVGSVTDYLGNLIGWSNIPSNISGNTFTTMVEQELNTIEQYTSTTISSNSIPEKYQPALCDLVHSKILLSLDETTGGIVSASLGDLSINKGTSSYSEISKQMREDAIQRLKELQRSVRFARIIGV